MPQNPRIKKLHALAHICNASPPKTDAGEAWVLDHDSHQADWWPVAMETGGRGRWGGDHDKKSIRGCVNWPVHRVKAVTEEHIDALSSLAAELYLGNWSGEERGSYSKGDCKASKLHKAQEMQALAVVIEKVKRGRSWRCGTQSRCWSGHGKDSSRWPLWKAHSLPASHPATFLGWKWWIFTVVSFWIWL